MAMINMDYITEVKNADVFTAALQATLKNRFRMSERKKGCNLQRHNREEKKKETERVE